jgi:hypothetical protein
MSTEGNPASTSPPASPTPSASPAPAAQPRRRTAAPAAITPSQNADLTPQARWERGRQSHRAADPWVDPNSTMTRNDRGEVQVADDAAPAGEPQPTTKVGEVELTEEELRGLLERKGLEDSRKLTLPAEPSAYKLELPANFRVPPGIEFAFATNDPVKGPLIEQAKAFAHKAGLDQGQFNTMMGLFAASEINEITTLTAARDAEIAKLGAMGSQRITAIQNFLRGNLGDDLAKTMAAVIVTEKHVRGWEKLMQKMSGGGSSFSHQHREADDSPKLSDAQWDSMSYSEKRAYSEKASAGGSGRR